RSSRDAPSRHKPDAHRRVQVASRNMADGKGHSQNGEAEGQGDAGISDADTRDPGGKHSRSASAENQPKCSKEFRHCTFTHWHGNLLKLRYCGSVEKVLAWETERAKA